MSALVLADSGPNVRRLRAAVAVASILSLVAAAGSARPAGAQGLPAAEPARVLRSPALSPDGKTVAFSYAGNLWTAPAAGGEARPLTLHEAHHIAPVWSPDGKTVAFAANRNGSYNIFLIPASGGRATRLTFSSASDVPCSFSPDGKTLLFRSNREPTYPPTTELYTVPVEGGTPRRITRAGGTFGVFSPRGDRIAYVRGYGSASRRGYRGSASNDIWTCAADGSDNKRVADWEGDDSSPMFSADGKTLYFVSDRTGRRNLWKMPLDNPAKAEQLTHHDSDEVRRARISDNGEAICYEFDHGLWVYNVATGRTAEAKIIAPADDKTNPVEKRVYTAGASEMEPSPDNRQIALVIRGEVFALDENGGPAARLTDSPANDRDVAWAPDGKRLLFVTDRDGFDQIYSVESADPKRPELSKARKLKTQRVGTSSEPEHGPLFSPDGKQVLFFRGAENLWVMDADGKNARQVVKGPRVHSPAWSPDGKWVAYVGGDADYGNDVFVAAMVTGSAAAGMPKAPVNVTRWGTAHGDVQWSLDGRRLVYTADHDEGWAVYVQELQRPAAEGESGGGGGFGGGSGGGGSPSVAIDFDDIHRRIRKVNGTDGVNGPAALSPNGRFVAFRGGRDGADLMVADVNGAGVRRVAAELFPQRIVWSRDGLRVMALDRNGSIRMAVAGVGGLPLPGSGGSGGSGSGFGGPTPETVNFRAEMEVDRAAEFEEMFRQSWRLLADRFYDPTYHGVDWPAVRARFEPLVRHIQAKEDLYELIQEMVGELNASHLGISGQLPRRPGEVMGYLGLDFDPAHTGAGLKVSGILKGGPCDKLGLDIRVGDYLMAVNGKPVGGRADLDKLLLGSVFPEVRGGRTVASGRTITLTVNKKPELTGGFDYDVKPVDASLISSLAYDRWVARNAALVEAASGGKLGYIHIEGMDEESLERYKRALFGDCRDKAGLVLDVRFNPGGFTHDSVLDLLGGKPHTHFIERGSAEKGTVMRSWNRKWSKPVILLINERSASDAEIFPAAFRKLGLGKLVGKRTMGAVIGTTGTRLIDGSTFRLPRLGVYTVDGEVNLENSGVRPDIEVENTPDDLSAGVDAQLNRAVATLLEEIEPRRPATPPTMPAKPAETPTSTPAPVPAKPAETPSTGKPTTAPSGR